MSRMEHQEFFQYKTHFTGGTEIMARLFHEKVAPLFPLFTRFNCILLPGIISLPSYQSLLEQDKDIVLWLHNNPHEFLPPVNLEFFRNQKFHEKLRMVIVVSEFAKNTLIQQSGIHGDKVEVIYNAIEPIPINTNKFQDTSEPQLIYLSQPERGLKIALQSLHQRNENFSFAIYGDVPADFLSALPREIVSDPRFIFHGRRSHDEVIRALSDSHIFVYPSQWYETFCVSLVEALTAGCIAVYNSIGSLGEVGMGHGVSYTQTDLGDESAHIKQLSEAMDRAFLKLSGKDFSPMEQRLAMLEKFSVEQFVISWFRVGAKLLANSNIDN
jgi:glycosyltransferase involved in cell wall biosynthesis